MKKKAILINSLSAGGAERVVSILANSNVTDCDFILIWPDQFFTLNVIKPKALLQKKGFIVTDLIYASIVLFRLIKSEKYHSINSHLFWSNYLNVFVSLFSKHDTICTHCVSFRSKFKDVFLSRLFHHILMKYLLCYSDKHTYKSIEMKKEYEGLFQLRNGMVIFNPLDFDNIINKSKKNIDFSFSKDKFYILSVGRFHKTKNQKKIIETLARLDDYIEVIFLGDGDELNSCVKLAEKLGVNNRTHFIGKVDNPYPYYVISNMYLSCSSSEGFPNTLIESLCLNCFPVHTDCHTGPREIISNLLCDKPSYCCNEFELFDLGVLMLGDNVDCISKTIDFVLKENPCINRVKAENLLFPLDFLNISKQYRDIHKDSFI